MKINVLLGIIIFCALTWLAILENLPGFIDLASFIIVIGGSTLLWYQFLGVASFLEPTTSRLRRAQLSVVGLERYMAL